MILTGWGRYPRIRSQARSFESPEELSRAMATEGVFIPHGMGRSYGDSALNDHVVVTRRFNRILDFDPATGLVQCEAGVTLSELIDVFLPRGWFLSVTPGTKHITVGGAIASDVHGKNHHVAGCFSSCVAFFDLMLADGEIKRCSPEQNVELFRATCGGMGLTGVILAAGVRLQPVQSAFIDQVTLKASNLRDIFDLFEAYASWTYSVAWIDCLAKGESLGRSLLMVGEHRQDRVLRPRPKKPLNVPVEFPSFALNPFSVALFNTLYYHRIRTKVVKSVVDVNSFFYPLDAIGNWNRIYGKGGFTQYQCVLPTAASYEGLRVILGKISEAGLGSFLAVLKLFGEENANWLSFPRAGYTLALDFKIEPQLFPLLDALDRVVLDYGGRIYLTKDVRMLKPTFEAGYPRLDGFRGLRERLGLHKVFQSLQSKRLEF